MKHTFGKLGIAVLLAGTAAASFGEDKLNMLLISGNGAASEFTEKAVLRDPKVTLVIAEDFNARAYNADRLDLRNYAIKELPAVLIVGRDGTMYRHEGSFRDPSEFIAFALAAKRGMTEPKFVADAAVHGQPVYPSDGDGSAGE